MSGEIKILFYIIVGIIYLISRFFNQEKKKQSQRDVHKKPVDFKTAEDIFEELKKSILGSETSKPEQPAKEKALYKKMERNPEQRAIIPDKGYRKKTAPIENTFTEEPHLTHENEITHHDYNEVKTSLVGIDFDEIEPRKAFIYGEIFKRPQY